MSDLLGVTYSTNWTKRAAQPRELDIFFHGVVAEGSVFLGARGPGDRITFNIACGAQDWTGLDSFLVERFKIEPLTASTLTWRIQEGLDRFGLEADSYMDFRAAYPYPVVQRRDRPEFKGLYRNLRVSAEAESFGVEEWT